MYYYYRYNKQRPNSAPNHARHQPPHVQQPGHQPPATRTIVPLSSTGKPLVAPSLPYHTAVTLPTAGEYAPLPQRLTHLGRLVVIDALNVARGHACPADPARGCARALVAAINHFTARGHPVCAILPAWALGGARALLNCELLRPFIGRQVHASPPGADDDKFCLAVAQRKDAFVLSNDLYRDHVADGAVTREWLDARRMPFMFVGGEIFPVSPGRKVSPMPLSSASQTTSTSVAPTQKPLKPIALEPIARSENTAVNIGRPRRQRQGDASDGQSRKRRRKHQVGASLRV